MSENNIEVNEASTSKEENVSKSLCHTRMNLVKTNFIWKISNFKYFLMKGEKLLSSTFTSEMDNKIIWRLGADQDVDSDDNSKNWLIIDLYLVGCSYKKMISVDARISILDSSKRELYITPCRRTFKEHEHFAFKLNMEDLITKLNVLCDDTLIISCIIKSGLDFIVENISINKDHNFYKNLCKDFAHLFENINKFSDVIIICEEKKIEVNKNILAARSPVFSAMFQHNKVEGNKNEVNIKEIRYEVLEEILRFMYCAKVKDVDNTADNLLLVAEKYQIVDLKTMCEETLCESLCINNVIQHLRIADLCKANKLKNRSIRFLKAHAMDIIGKEELKEISLSDPNLTLEVFSAINS